MEEVERGERDVEVLYGKRFHSERVPFRCSVRRSRPPWHRHIERNANSVCSDAGSGSCCGAGVGWSVK
jgi:hypothetical protein